MDVVMATSIQHNHNVGITSVLSQLCEECEMWTIHDHMIAFPEPCIKALQKFHNDMVLVWYAGSIFWHQSLSIISPWYSKSSHKPLSKGLELIKNDKLQFCSLKPYKKNFLALDFPSILKTTNFKEVGVYVEN